MSVGRLNAAFLAYYLRYWPKRFARARRLRAPDASCHIYVDVSIIFRRDSGTGIQRVVRALMAQLVEKPPEGCNIIPVIATKHRPYRALTLEDWRSGDQSAIDRAATIVPKKGDIFLGLELSAHLIPRHVTQMRWFKSRGLRIVLLLYDLLPHQSPEYFTPINVKKFRPWLDFLLAHADAAVCISQTVANQLRDALLRAHSARTQKMHIAVIPMGGDLMSSPLHVGISNSERAFLDDCMSGQRTILMVGTVEPRKAYGVALDAMEWIWRHAPERNARLVIVGRQGWQSDSLEHRLCHHPEMGKRLFRFDDVSDEYLAALYQNSCGLLMASYAEGFGLPVLEALQTGLPVLARDIPVFRELDRAGMSYFMKDDPPALGPAILRWLEHGKAQFHTGAVAELTWENAGRRLAEILGTLP